MKNFAGWRARKARERARKLRKDDEAEGEEKACC